MNFFDAPYIPQEHFSLDTVLPLIVKHLPPIFRLFFLLPAICHGEAQVKSTLIDSVVFSHVNVISMRTDSVLTDQTVVVQGDKILRVGPANRIPVPKHTLQVNGLGKYLMPGLADLHVHLFSSDDLVSYTTYGVTTVLNMDGSPMHLNWREQVRKGDLLGPTIYTASHTVDGLPPLNELFVTAERPQDAGLLVRESKLAGYDFIKLYGTLRPDVFRAIMEASLLEGMPVVGHVNRQVGALEVLKSPQVLAAHLEDLLFARFDHLPSDAELEEFAAAIAASHITVTPNLNVNPNNIAQLKDLNSVLKSPEARLLPPAAYSQWLSANNRNEKSEQVEQQIEDIKSVQRTLYKLVNLLNARRVRLVLGTDAAAYGFPGLSVHQELEELVEAGFTPYQALLTATRNSGVFVAENIPNAARFGTVEEGSAADLMLLSANPLSDIGHLRKIDGVMLKGRWLSSSELDKLQASAVAHFDHVKQRLEKIDYALEGGDIASAHKFAEPLETERSPWIAEWVMMTKARKLQWANLPAAIQIARWNTRLFPQSFSASYLLADLLLQNQDSSEALIEAKLSLKLEPHNAATLNLLEKIETLQKPLLFTPVGTYNIQYMNGVSGEIQTANLVVEKAQNGQFKGTKTDPGKEETSPLRSVYAGGNRMWVVANTPFGPLEFRISVTGKSLEGYWAGPFGRNGKLTGEKLK